MNWVQLEQWLLSHLAAVLLGLLLFALVFLGVGLFFMITALSLKKRYRRLMAGRDGLDLEEVLNRYGDLISGNAEKLQSLDKRLLEAERQLQLALAGVGLVRFNAFPETGGDLSFSLALLDRRQNGVVITSIFGREDSRCYGKPIREGRAVHLLSDEEKQALAEAKRNLK